MATATSVRKPRASAAAQRHAAASAPRSTPRISDEPCPSAAGPSPSDDDDDDDAGRASARSGAATTAPRCATSSSEPEPCHAIDCTSCMKCTPATAPMPAMMPVSGTSIQKRRDGGDSSRRYPPSVSWNTRARRGLGARGPSGGGADPIMENVGAVAGGTSGAFRSRGTALATLPGVSSVVAVGCWGAVGLLAGCLHDLVGRAARAPVRAERASARPSSGATASSPSPRRSSMRRSSPCAATSPTLDAWSATPERVAALVREIDQLRELVGELGRVPLADRRERARRDGSGGAGARDRRRSRRSPIAGRR